MGFSGIAPRRADRRGLRIINAFGPPQDADVNDSTLAWGKINTDMKNLPPKETTHG